MARIKIYYKGLIIFFIVISFITSCKQEEKKKSLTDLVKIELDKGIRKDTVFLGYVFGMSNEQASNHESKLLKNDILHKLYIRDNHNNYKSKQGSYISFGKYEKVFVQHYLDFYQNKIYKVSAFIETTPRSDSKFDFMKSDINKYTALVKFYKQKYGEPSISFDYDDEIEIYIWLEGNRKIQIQPMPLLDRIYIYYEDMILSKKLKEENKEKEDSLNNSIKKQSKEII